MSGGPEQQDLVLLDELFESWSVGKAILADFAHFQDSTVLKLIDHFVFLYPLRNFLGVGFDASEKKGN